MNSTVGIENPPLRVELYLVVASILFPFKFGTVRMDFNILSACRCQTKKRPAGHGGPIAALSPMYK
jgi:hypothetical protein